jgi:beta-lactamase regulating signal transducer with metallopeptidase domain
MNPFTASTMRPLAVGEFAIPVTLTLIHFLWQGVLFGLVALVCDRCLNAAAARMRYAVFVAILLAMGLAPPVTFLLIHGVATSDQEPVPIQSPARLVAAGNVAAGRPRLAEAPVDAEAGRSAPVLEPVAVSDPEAVVASSALAPSPSRARSIEFYAPSVLTAYLMGAVIMLARLAVALQGGRRLRLAAVAISDGPIAELVRRQAKQLGLKTAPLIAWCGRVSVPVVVGIVRPMILLPSALATGFEPSQLEALLTHELAHIRRFDPLVNLLQRLIEVLLFFHPAVWYVSRRVSAERENACDDLVVSAGWPAVRYAQALLQMAEFCATARGISAQSNAALAASGAGPSQFKRRVLRLLEIEDVPRIRLSRGGLLLAAAASVLTFTSPTLIRALNTQGNQPNTEQKQPSVGQALEAQQPPAKKSPILERVFAAWKARQDRVKSFHFTWDTRMVLPMGYEFSYLSPIAGLRTWEVEVDSEKAREFTIPGSEWWGQGDNLLRSDLASVVYDGANGWKQTGRIRLIDNGILHSRLEMPLTRPQAAAMSIWRQVTIKNPSGMSSGGNAILHDRWLEVAPLRLALRPFAKPTFDSPKYPDKTLVWSPENCRVVGENAIVGKLHCIKLEHGEEGCVESCWVDPQRDYVVVLWERRQGQFPARSIVIEYQKDPEQGWLPSSWSWETPSTFGHKTAAFTAKVTSYSIDKDFREDPFANTAPPGAQIFDATADRPIPSNWDAKHVEEPPDAAAIRDAIATAWSKRQAQIKRFKVDWQRQAFFERDSMVHSFCVDGERLAEAYSTPNRTVARPAPRPAGRNSRYMPRMRPVYEFRSVFDGTTRRQLAVADPDDDQPPGPRVLVSIFNGLGRNGELLPGERQLMLIFHPFDRRFRTSIDLAKFKVAKERQTIDGTSCVVIEMEDEHKIHHTYWLDPAREYLVLRQHRTLNGLDSDRVDFSYRADPTCGWVPTGWKDASIGQDGTLSFAHIDTVTTARFNQPLADSEFQIEIPKGAEIEDQRKKGS